MRFLGFAAGGLALWIALSAVAVVASGAVGGPALSLGLDLQSGVRLLYAAEGASARDLELAADVVRRRIESIDADAQVYVAGDRIAIELEGSEHDAAAARSLIAENAHLEFRALDDAFDVASRVPSPPAGVTTESEVVPLGFEGEQHRTTYFAATGPGARERLRSIAPALDLGARELLIGERTAWEEVEGAPSGFRTYVAERTAPVDGTMVTDAYASVDSYNQMPTVTVEFDERGTRAFGDMTSALVRRRIAIVLNGEVVSAPVVNEPITIGRAMIALGSLEPQAAMEEATALAVRLRSGALPAPLRLVSEDVIGATYGAGALPAALSILAFIALGALLFGLVRYRAAGLALAAPLLVAFPAMALGAMLGATVTLPVTGAFALALLVGLAAAIPLGERARAARVGIHSNRWVAAALPGIAMIALGVIAAVLYAALSGPMRGFAMSLLLTALAGVLVASLWSFAVAAALWPRPATETDPPTSV